MPSSVGNILDWATTLVLQRFKSHDKGFYVFYLVTEQTTVYYYLLTNNKVIVTLYKLLKGLVSLIISFLYVMPRHTSPTRSQAYTSIDAATRSSSFSSVQSLYVAEL